MYPKVMSFIHISIIEVTYNISEIPGECKTSGFKAMLDPEGLPKPLVGSVALREGNPNAMLLTCDQLWVHQSANNLMKKPRAHYSSVSSSKTIHDIKDHSETRDIVLKNMLFYSTWVCLRKKKCCWETVVVQSVAVLLSRASKLHCCHLKSLACPTACFDDYS